MGRNNRRSGLLIALSLWLAWIPAFAGNDAYAIGSVTVMADPSMNIPIAEIARDYSRHAQIVVNTSFAPPVAQEAQITEGGAADILITSKQSWIEQLKERGLIDVYSQTAVARNRLALVGPIDSPLHVDMAHGFPATELIKQMGGEPLFVIGNPETLMMGSYSKEALRNMEVADDLEPYTLYIKSLDEMFDMVTKQQAYGIFFYSTTISRSGLRVLDLLPENAHRPITYFAVVIAGDNMNAARQFLDYLKSSEAKQVFRENGFSVD